MTLTTKSLCEVTVKLDSDKRSQPASQRPKYRWIPFHVNPLPQATSPSQCPKPMPQATTPSHYAKPMPEVMDKGRGKDVDSCVDPWRTIQRIWHPIISMPEKLSWKTPLDYFPIDCASNSLGSGKDISSLPGNFSHFLRTELFLWTFLWQDRSHRSEDIFTFN